MTYNFKKFLSTMTNEYIDYYLNQSGTGISGFSGLRYQKGLMESFFKFIRPVLAYFTKQGIKTAANIGSDLLEGESLKTSAKIDCQKQVKM